MGHPLLAEWTFQSTSGTTSKIIPDGCRDLILWSPPGQRPKWRITALDCSPHHAQIDIGTRLHGFRLQPGTSIKSAQLLGSLQHLEEDMEKVLERLDTYCTRSTSIAEAISCVGAPTTKNIQDAAKQLGVSIRTLQRLLSASTGRTPARWLALARARRAARQVAVSERLAETAYECGFADQAHMSREFLRWFETSPSRISRHPNILQQLNQPGYY